MVDPVNVGVFATTDNDGSLRITTDNLGSEFNLPTMDNG